MKTIIFYIFLLAGTAGAYAEAQHIYQHTYNVVETDSQPESDRVAKDPTYPHVIITKAMAKAGVRQGNPVWVTMIWNGGQRIVFQAPAVDFNFDDTMGIDHGNQLILSSRHLPILPAEGVRYTVRINTRQSFPISQ
jgi:hypothetical protein